MNLYRYVHNSPPNFTDPDGLTEQPLLGKPTVKDPPVKLLPPVRVYSMPDEILPEGTIRFSLKPVVGRPLLKAIRERQLENRTIELPVGTSIPEDWIGPKRDTVRIPLKSLDRKGRFQIDHPELAEFGTLKNPEIRLAYGVFAEGSFRQNGKKATDPDTSFYWVQFVRTERKVYINGQLHEGHSSVTPWEVDGRRGPSDRRYEFQAERGDHHITDLPSAPVPIEVTALPNQGKTELIFSLEDNLDRVAANFQRDLKEARVRTVTKWEFQTYLVRDNDGKPQPLGYVSWGFTVIFDEPGLTVSNVQTPAWVKEISQVWNIK